MAISSSDRLHSVATGSSVYLNKVRVAPSLEQKTEVFLKVFMIAILVNVLDNLLPGILGFLELVTSSTEGYKPKLVLSLILISEQNFHVETSAF